MEESVARGLAELRDLYLRRPRVPEGCLWVIQRWHHLRGLDVSDLPERCVEWWHMSNEFGWIQDVWTLEQVRGLLRRARDEATRPTTAYHCRVHIWWVIQSLVLCGTHADLELALDLAERAASVKGYCLGSGDMEEDAGLAFGLHGFGDTAVTRAVRGADDIEVLRALAAARRPTEIGAFDVGVASGIARVSAELADWPEVTEADGCADTAGLDAFDLGSLRRWAAPRLASPDPRVRAATWMLLAAGDPGTSDVSPETVALAWADVRTAADDEVVAEAGHYLWSQLPNTSADVLDVILSQVPGLTPRRVLDRTWHVPSLGLDADPRRWLRFYDALLPACRQARGELRREVRSRLHEAGIPAPDVALDVRPYRDAIWSTYFDSSDVSAWRVWHEPELVRDALDRHIAALATTPPTARLRTWYRRDRRLARAWLRVVDLRVEQPPDDPDDVVSRHSDRTENRTLDFLAAFIREFADPRGDA